MAFRVQELEEEADGLRSEMAELSDQLAEKRRQFDEKLSIIEFVDEEITKLKTQQDDLKRQAEDKDAAAEAL